MAKNPRNAPGPPSLLDAQPEVFVSNTRLSDAVFRAQRRGALRKIGPRLYTRNMTAAPEDLVRRNLWPLVGSYAPGALVADRTAIENAPAADGSVFIAAASRTRNIELPGVTIRPRPGSAPLEDDRSFIGGLFLSSNARAYLENMAPSRRRGGGGVSRTLTRVEIEERLEAMLRRGGEDALNRLRGRAREIAPALGLEDEFTKLDALIGALFGTREAELTSPAAAARRRGAPFDPDRLKLIEVLHADLRAWPAAPRPAHARTEDGRAAPAFFEAYFSNFIEGTEFDVSETAGIVFDGKLPPERPADAHDVLGTWRIVSDDNEMARTPETPEAFLDLLRARHANLMAGRPEARPGEFKTAVNRAGCTVFVAPELVCGTLEQGFGFYSSLNAPFARAVMMMFLTAEVHPFTDGNGRVARIMMNAELAAAGEERMIIPTVYRNNYLAALRAFSQSGAAAGAATALIRTLDYAQKWTAAVPWGGVEQTKRVLERCNAFVDANHADMEGIRLEMPLGKAG